MGRTGASRRLAAALAIAGVAALTASMAAVSPVAAASPGPIGPVGQVQASLLAPSKHQRPPSAHSKQFLGLNPAALRKAKLKASQQTSPTPSPSNPPAGPALSSAALFNGLNSPGLSAADQGYQPTPPDSTGAIGPTRYLEFVNNLVGVYDRSNLSLVGSTDLGSFTFVPSGLATSDPQIQWDPQGNRWFYVAIGFTSNLNNSYILFGWSKTSDPSDLANGWCRYQTQTGTNFPDYPKLGHDANFVVIGVNTFDTSKPGLPFVTGDIWVAPKPPSSQSTCSSSVTASHFADAAHPLKNTDGTLAATPVPANTVDSSANDYIVSAHDPSSAPQSKLMTWHIAPGPSLVADGDISVASYSIPPNVPQPGTSYLIDSLDGRLTQAVANFDPVAGAEAVWTQHSVGNSGRSMVRWYEILPGSHAVRQAGQVASATDFIWNAAISPSISGDDAMIEYNRASATLLPLIGAQTRTRNTPLGQMDPGEVQLAASSAATQETLFSGNCTSNPCRWGDYSGATPDPLNPGVVWGSNQVTGQWVFGLAQWETQNFAITTNGAPPAPPSTPTGVTATAMSSSQITVAWSPATGATSYKIQRSPDGSSGWTQAGTSNTTSFTDGGLTPSTTYFYRVIASNSVGDSGPSTAVSATTQAGLAYTQAPQGSWVGVYGADGYALLAWNGSGDLVSLPQASLAFDQGGRFQWSGGTSDVRALQSPDATTRRAATWHDDNQVRLRLVFSAAYTGTLHLYAVDWDNLARREIVAVDDGSGPRSATISTDFTQGVWVNAPISVGAGGTVSVTVTHTGGRNAVLSGIFLGGAPALPAAPTGLSATPASASQINLGWTASSGAASYKVQRSPDGSTGWAQVGTSATTSFSDSGLTPSTTYYYRVIATNGVGDSAPSAVASATTLAGLGYTQAPQGTWVGTYGGDGYALLNWNNGSDAVSLPQSTLSVDQGSRFQWSSATNDVRALQSPDASTRRAETVYFDSEVRLRLVFSSAYTGTLRVYVVDWDALGRRENVTINDGSGPRTATISGDFSQGAWVNAPINVPSGGTVSIVVTRTAGVNAVVSGLFLGGAPGAAAPPTGLTATAISTTQIALAWNASSGAASYKVQRSPDGSTGWTQIATPGGTSFTDSGLTPATTYFYRVLATNTLGDSAPSNVASATTQASLPYSQAPQGTWVGAYGADGYALLNWNNGSDLVSLPQSSLSADQGSRFQWSSGTTDVRALQSPDASTRRAVCLFDGDQVRLRLVFSAAYSGTLHVYAVDFDALGRRENVTVNDGSGPRTATISTDFSQGAWINAPISVAAGGTVTITVTRTGGMNAVVSGLFLGGAPATPAAPTGLTTTPVSSSQVNLAWSSSSGAASYKVQRSANGTSGWTQITSTTATAYSDTGLNPSTAYFYRVIATNSVGDSPPSSVASATTQAGLPYTQAPQGSWVGTYGADGYALLNWTNGGDLVSLPQCTMSIDQGSRFQWSAGTTDVRALQSPDGSTRRAETIYFDSEVRIRLTFSTAYSGTLHVYVVDWDGLSRRENVTVNDGSGPRTATISSDFSQGAWINVPISVAAGGTVSIVVNRTAGVNAVVSGVFLG